MLTKRTKCLSGGRVLALALVLILAAPSMIFASIAGPGGNRQEIVSVDDPLYEAMRNLYVAAGLAQPSTTGPWSMAEFDIMLARIDTGGLTASEMETYNWIKSRIEETERFNPKDNEIFGFTIGGDVALELYSHTNPGDFPNVDNWAGFDKFGDYHYPSPLIAMPLETWFGDNIYGYSSFSLGVPNTFIDNDELEASNWYTNIWLVPPSQLNDLDFGIPMRAFGSIGGKWWNFSIGREKLRWGPGVSGNLTVGDSLPYQNNARFSAFSDMFKYTFSVSSFTHPKSYVADWGSGNASDHLTSDNPTFDQTHEVDGLKLFIAHRLEWRIFDKVNMALTESIMYQSEDNHIDLLVLSPTAIFHNYYIRSNANSLLSFEVDYTPVSHLNIYGELIVDEFRLPGEFTNDGPPSAMGYILGARTSWAIGDGLLYGSLEGAYTDPYLYLRDSGTRGTKEYGINFIVDSREWANGGDIGGNYDLNYLGYKYGNDSVVGNLAVGYEKYGKWYAEAEFTYWADGTMDMFSKWDEVVPGSSDDPNAPSSSHPSSGSWLDGSNYSDRDAVAHWTILSLKGGYNILKGLDAYAQLRWVNVVNYENIKGEKASDLQFSLGLSYSF